ncbi:MULTISPECIES: mobilization protein [Hyphomicrobiales]|uniref:mobilization protein n=1 Tax=Hyphomicrobiales TaxID=356 RepID=UPI000FCA8738|nr:MULTISPECIES: mobilization protein [Hyphomicrobiales]MCY1741032.1 mobilization protein [Ensifer sp. SL37]RUV67795.1 mobilization protein [Mesorhizobium sp. M5C.F.Cr.IN.023.01.1.1]
MARKTIEQRLAELEAQRSALKARLSKQERANDTRRKVLLGALVLHRLENTNDPEFTKRLGDWLRRELPGFLTRDSDKTLFADLLDAKNTSEPANTSPSTEQPA